VKRNRNDTDISDEKMENLKRTLRARKEVLTCTKIYLIVLMKPISQIRTQLWHVKESKVHIAESPMAGITVRSASNVSLTGQQKTLSKTQKIAENL